MVGLLSGGGRGEASAPLRHSPLWTCVFVVVVFEGGGGAGGRAIEKLY